LVEIPTIVFAALVLTAMLVGLATEQLKDNTNFQRASYGFTILAILGILGAVGLVLLGALFNLVKDLPCLILNHRMGAQVDQSLEWRYRIPLSIRFSW
jgi:hypothetical protein